MRGILKGSGLVFCNKSNCEGEVDFDFPAIFESHDIEGSGVAFFQSEEVCRAEGCDILLFPREVAVFFSAENRNCIFQTEFVAGDTHIVSGMKNTAVLQCGGECCQIIGSGLKKADCTLFGDCDYILLQWKKSVCVVCFCDGKYDFVKIPATDYQISGEEAKFSFASQTSGGCTLFGSCNWKFGLAGFEDFKYTKFELKYKENFNTSTFDNYFFEILFIARLLESGEREKFIKKYLTAELAENIEGVLEYIGNFCGLIPQIDGVICIYETENNIFKSRKFTIEKETFFGKTQVSNIAEEEEFHLSNAKNVECESIFLTR